MGRAIGIDLGTTNSCVAVYDNGKAKVIPAGGGERTTPSVVAIDKHGKHLVGALAKRQQVLNPTSTISSVKRLMGRLYKELPEDMEAITVTLTEAESERVQVHLGSEVLAPEEISAQILRHLREAAEKVIGESVTDAVITVPAYFNDAQRQATKDAGRIAGLNVLRIINEPTAAAMAYGIDQGEEGEEQTIVVFDLGGGTFDVSVLEIADGTFFEVQATAGDNRLGGDDFDAVIVKWLLARTLEETGLDLSVDKRALQALYSAAEKAKRELSEWTETEITIPFLAQSPDGPVNVEETLTRAQFEEMARPLIDRLEAPTKQALSDAGVKPGNIDEVILVGGMTRMPVVQELVERLVGLRPNQSVNPDEAVAIGAAIHANSLTDEESEVVLLDVAPLSLGLETKGGVMTKLIERNTTIPTTRTEMFSTAEDNQPSVELHILQGERDMVKDNRTLEKLHLLDMPPAARGIPKIEVTFAVDADGILKVSARDQATQKEVNKRIEKGSGMPDEDINKMIADAEANAERDRAERERAELRNQAETLAYQAERMLRESGASISAGAREGLADAAAEVRECIAGEFESDELRSVVEKLMASAQSAAEAMYEAAGVAAAVSAADSVDAVDADFVDLDAAPPSIEVEVHDVPDDADEESVEAVDDTA